MSKMNLEEILYELLDSKKYCNFNNYKSINEFNCARNLLINFCDIFTKVLLVRSIKKSIFNEERTNKNTLIVYHEADLDGHGIKIFANILNHISDINYTTYGCMTKADEALGEILSDKYDKVVIADLSFTKECILNNTELGKINLTILDHHSSALINNSKLGLVIPHDENRAILSSGTLLFMVYYFDDLNKYLSPDIMQHLIKFALVVAMYDTWFWNSEIDDIRELCYYDYGNLPEDLSIFFKANTSEFVDDLLFKNLLKLKFFTEDTEYQLKFQRIANRKMCYKYYHNLKIIQVDNGMKIGIVFGDDDVSTIGNFILRANKELSVFIMINLNKGKVMLRSRSNYDLTHIVEKNNGGGHPQAAGFDLVKTDVENIIVNFMKYIPYMCVSLHDIKDVGEMDINTKTYKLAF